jgi:pyrroloquinoline-quinone synthase
MELIERLDEVRTHWKILDHPFYRRWERGDLTREDLAFYAGEYHHAVVALADAAAATGDAEHAREEAQHIRLWDDFADSLEASLDRAPRDGTAECVNAWRRSDPLEARAVLYAVESGQPAISQTKLEGLVRHYGFEARSRSTAYFEIHATRDGDHAASSRAVLEQEARPQDADRLVAAAECALRGNWRLLDTVEDATA